jgi:D-3-phosphoglycerate dehydrogenase
MKILVSDSLGQVGVDRLAAEPQFEVDVNTGLSPEALEAVIGDYDALIIRSATKVTRRIVAAASRLKVIGRAGIGLDNVDIEAATEKGIVVMNTPLGNVVTTAEHAIAMMMALSRNIPEATASIREGRWAKKELQGREIFGKTLGVIGFGKIGSIVADRAKGLNMSVIVHDPVVSPERIGKAGFESVSLPDLYRRADFITIHVPKLKETHHLIDRTAFEQMKDGVMLVNCARGGIVDESDLCDAMRSGKVAGAALDVFETEPPERSPLFEMDHFICTPHLGASTAEAQLNVASAIASQVIDFLKNGTVANAVNAPAVTGDLLRRLSPFIELGDHLGCLQAQLVCGPVKEMLIEYLGDFRGLDMSPVTMAVVKGFLAPTVRDDVNSVNAIRMAEHMGIHVVEKARADAEEFFNLIRVTVVAQDMEQMVAGTIYGKKDPRIVQIGKFRLELVPSGHLALIHNEDKPGAIGSIGVTLGKHQINIGKMQVGQEEEGNRNIIFLCTDTPIPPAVQEELRQLPLVKMVLPLEF